MYCPSCGFEATQKTNFCKRCGVNMNPSTNSVEIRMPKFQVTGMVFIIALFSIVGLITTLVGIDELTSRNIPGGGLIIALLGSLLFVFSVAGLLVWQLARLISTYQDAVRQTIQKAQSEPQPAAAFYSQPQQTYISAVADPVQSSVTEHTTRQMAAKYNVPRVNE
jgi:hypothetical protein